MYSFTNHFNGSTLRERIIMMNRPDSGRSVWIRYVMLGLVLCVATLFACRHKVDNRERDVRRALLPATNPTRAMVLELEDKNWFCHLSLVKNGANAPLWKSEPIAVVLRGNQFALADEYRNETILYINGKAASETQLQKLSPEFVDEVFVLRKWEYSSDAEYDPKPNRVLIQTSSHPIQFTQKRSRFFTLLQAAALSKHPFGETYSFNMNQLLEATFFHNKNALVERTKNQHLKLYDEFADNTDVLINGILVKPEDVTSVHVREVARLYTRERPFTDWFRADQPSSRFELNIQTAPSRAKRDSSYYVFSPFYSGDF
ncbi:hypothetical protein [Fibrisoma montanum]|nr:hypothetical protein [Fibrisoma montanum]